MKTLLELAREGQINETIKQAASYDQLSPETLREQIAAGKAVIPANKVHLKSTLKPLAIGRIATTKINANLGASANGSSIEGEREKLQVAIEYGAEAVMDLSTGGDLDAIRQMFVAESPVPVGTVPMYEMIIDRDIEDLTVDHILKIIEKQASQGVDFFTIHAGLLREYVPLTTQRICGIVSRGGALLAKWMEHHNRQNPLFNHFDDICAIMKEYDV
ncbi:MAG: hypothetical protein GX629_08905, partial [Phycisphaerae bacterium]|nr:hypothetical protein [Phycisphaerae bacterium]